MKILILFVSISLSLISSTAINAMTRDELMAHIANNAGHQVAGRQIAKTPAPFSKINATFIKIKKDGLIIFKDPSFSSETGRVIFYGVTKAGEVLQFLQKQQKVMLPNFLSNAPSDSGYWYQVKTAEGYIGWIYAGENQRDINKVLTVFKPSGKKGTAKSKGKSAAKKAEKIGEGSGVGNTTVVILVLIAAIFLIRLAIKGSKSHEPSPVVLGGDQQLHNAYQQYMSGGGTLGFNQWLERESSFSSSPGASQESSSSSISSEPPEKGKSAPEEAKWPFENRGRTEVVHGKIQTSLLGMEIGHIEPDPLSFGSIEHRLTKDVFVDREGHEKDVKTDFLGDKYIEDSKGNRIYIK